MFNCEWATHSAWEKEYVSWSSCRVGCLKINFTTFHLARERLALVALTLVFSASWLNSFLFFAKGKRLCCICGGVRVEMKLWINGEKRPCLAVVTRRTLRFFSRTLASVMREPDFHEIFNFQLFLLLIFLETRRRRHSGLRLSFISSAEKLSCVSLNYLYSALK